MVPAVWICRPPTSAAAARSASQAGGSAASRMAAQVVQAPMRRWPGLAGDAVELAAGR